jgi:DNA-binding phage protein
VDTRPFDPAQYLDSEEAIAAYLADAGADGDTALSDAAEVVARARKALSAVPSAAGVAESGATSFRRGADKG